MDRFEQYTADKNLPAFRYKQISHAIYKELVNDFEAITTIPKDLKTQISEEVPFTLLTEMKSLVSADKGTIKVLFRVDRINQPIEAVLMRHKDGRNTVCVSCMVGCPVNCTFCATGKMGFKGSLTGDEIVEQVLYFARLLKNMGEDSTISNVVFMGMGEPMLNLKEVKSSIQTLNEQFGLGKRRITVSTSGYVSQLYDLINWGYRGRIAISLHAPNQTLRQQLMPVVSKLYTLEQLMEALKKFEDLTNKRITYEYIMIQDVNDQEGHARELGQMLEGRLAHVNLIPYNPIRGANYIRSPKENIAHFQNTLNEYGVQNTVRVTMGDDVNAACGQLATEKN